MAHFQGRTVSFREGKSDHFLVDGCFNCCGLIHRRPVPNLTGFDTPRVGRCANLPPKFFPHLGDILQGSNPIDSPLCHPLKGLVGGFQQKSIIFHQFSPQTKRTRSPLSHPFSKNNYEQFQRQFVGILKPSPSSPSKIKRLKRSIFWCFNDS